jgi:hypothetical protein
MENYMIDKYADVGAIIINALSCTNSRKQLNVRLVVYTTHFILIKLDMAENIIFSDLLFTKRRTYY